MPNDTITPTADARFSIERHNEAVLLAKDDPVRLSEEHLSHLAALDQGFALRARAARTKALEDLQDRRAAQQAQTAAAPVVTEADVDRIIDEGQRAFLKAVDDPERFDDVSRWLWQTKGVPGGLRLKTIALWLTRFVGGMNEKNRERNRRIEELERATRTLRADVENALAELRTVRTRQDEIGLNAATAYRKIYDPTTQYHQGEFVTFNGAMWHANMPSKGIPPPGPEWTMCVQRGKPGKGAR